MHYKKPNLLCYRIAQIAAWLVATFVFRRKILRNEIKGKKGPFVVIANHQAALDFVNLIGATRRPMSFVISNSFFNTLPIRGFLTRMGVIPKQQFQTAVRDMKRMKAVIDHGEPIVIYPAGLMCEDGLSTPIPAATYKFLKWLDADVYVAKTSGTYFAMPKWSSGFRPGRTHLDIYKLFSREELKNLDLGQVKSRTDEALLFDAYREQEAFRVKYSNGSNIRGLEHVLYQCPHCLAEFSVEAVEKDRLRCSACGYEQGSDAYGFLHKTSSHGEELRYVSDWSLGIYGRLKEKLVSGEVADLSTPMTIRMIDYDRKKFMDVGHGTLSLNARQFTIDGVIREQPVSLAVSIAGVPTLPFKPGKYLEVQDGNDIYRCVPEDGRLVMKFINMVKIFHELSQNKERNTAKNPAVL
jgi:hypothetical protein